MTVTGVIALLVALAVATAFGLLRRARSGRLRAPRTPDASPAAPLTAGELGATALGERATLVHFSSAFCRPCVAVRHVLHDVAEKLPGVTAVEVDAESHLELVRRLNISSTPTTLLLDRGGVERKRATGVPKRDQVLAALGEVAGEA